jgi:hypothetical protein
MRFYLHLRGPCHNLVKLSQERMSRSEEKARAVLNRWRQLSAATNGAAGNGHDTKRRKLASECNSVKECESTRQRLVEQIARKIEEIVRMAPDEKCRQVNDDINKLMRTKRHWERQIRALGGPDYRQGQDSNEYVYYGAAKELPEVKAASKTRETDAEAAEISTLKSKRLKLDALTVEYYGLLDGAHLEEEEAKGEASVRRNISPKDLVHWHEQWQPATSEQVQLSILDYRKRQLLRKFAV